LKAEQHPESVVPAISSSLRLFKYFSIYAQMEVLVQYVRGSIPQCNFCRSDKKSLAKCRESCLLATWWQKMLYAIIYGTQMKGDQNLFHCSGTTFRCLCRRWCWEVCTLRWSLWLQFVLALVDFRESWMGGLIAATRWTNVAWSFHPTDFLLRPRLSSRSRWQSTSGDELTGVFICFSPVSVPLGSVLRVKTTRESASRFHFNDRWSKSSKTQ